MPAKDSTQPGSGGQFGPRARPTPRDRQQAGEGRPERPGADAAFGVALVQPERAERGMTLGSPFECREEQSSGLGGINEALLVADSPHRDALSPSRSSRIRRPLARRLTASDMRPSLQIGASP
jgi:hypothetical protein